MPLLTLAILAGIAVFVVLTRLAARERRRRHPPAASLLGTVTVMGEALPDEVRRHLQAGRSVDAIRALRESMGLELKDAYEMVEKLGRKDFPPGTDLLPAWARIEKALAAWESDMTLRELVIGARWPEARRYLRELYDLDGQDAAQVLDKLAARLNPPA